MKKVTVKMLKNAHDHFVELLVNINEKEKSLIGNFWVGKELTTDGTYEKEYLLFTDKDCIPLEKESIISIKIISEKLNLKLPF